MNTIVNSHAVQTRAASALCGLCLTLAPGFLAARAGASAPPKLSVQDTPIARQGQPGPSFSPVVKKVSPSVVNVYTAKTVRETPRLLPLLDDPFFRQFFGGPYGYENVPRERREQSLGSGVILSEEGYLLTNNH